MVWTQRIRKMTCLLFWLVLILGSLCFVWGVVIPATRKMSEIQHQREGEVDVVDG